MMQLAAVDQSPELNVRKEADPNQTSKEGFALIDHLGKVRTAMASEETANVGTDFIMRRGEGVRRNCD
jgi:hypothetical protein